MLADENVDSIPEKRAETATPDTSPARPGATCDRIAIWTPNEPRFPKPYMVCQFSYVPGTRRGPLTQHAYVAISLARELMLEYGSSDKL